jgi:hypothetical protein
MLSLFIMYSSDRRFQLEQTVAHLRQMGYFEECQKTIVLDGDVPEVVDGFEVIRVPRIAGSFNWARMWDAGVASARYPIVWYLDSDRLLPRNYIQLLMETVKDDVFAFTTRHFMVLEELTEEAITSFLTHEEPERLLMSPEYLGKLKFDPRFPSPPMGPGKNVMSGNTAFTKKTYLKLKGVDPWYRGHGAYADTDFHMAAERAGCDFHDLEVPELHCHHHKLSDQKEALPTAMLHQLGLDNFIYFCKKWDLPMSYAENLATRIGLHHPVRYVHAKLTEYATGST